MSENGTIVAISAPQFAVIPNVQIGAVFVYRKQKFLGRGCPDVVQPLYKLQQVLLNPEPGVIENYAMSVSISGDGLRLLVGSNTIVGGVFLYQVADRCNSCFSLTQKIETPDETFRYFGNTVKLSSNGQLALIRAFNSVNFQYELFVFESQKNSAQVQTRAICNDLNNFSYLSGIYYDPDAVKSVSNFVLQQGGFLFDFNCNSNGNLIVIGMPNALLQTATGNNYLETGAVLVYKRISCASRHWQLNQVLIDRPVNATGVSKIGTSISITSNAKQLTVFSVLPNATPNSFITVYEAAKFETKFKFSSFIFSDSSLVATVEPTILSTTDNGCTIAAGYTASGSVAIYRRTTPSFALYETQIIDNVTGRNVVVSKDGSELLLAANIQVVKSFV